MYFKQLKGAIPQRGHQILAIKKFEDHPMFPENNKDTHLSVLIVEGHFFW